MHCPPPPGCWLCLSDPASPFLGVRRPTRHAGTAQPAGRADSGNHAPRSNRRRPIGPGADFLRMLWGDQEELPAGVRATPIGTGWHYFRPVSAFSAVSYASLMIL